jgi:DNA-binding CsgD family transcriptional regulator
MPYQFTSPVLNVKVDADNSNLNKREFNVTDESNNDSKYNIEFLVYNSEQNEQIEARENIYDNVITSREKEVLQLLSDGDSSKIIADKLHISETTAITHRKNLIQKLQVKNTAHLIKIAVLAKIVI